MRGRNGGFQLPLHKSSTTQIPAAGLRNPIDGDRGRRPVDCGPEFVVCRDLSNGSPIIGIKRSFKEAYAHVWVGAENSEIRRHFRKVALQLFPATHTEFSHHHPPRKYPRPARL